MSMYYIAGVANVDIFKGSQLIATARTLADSSITLGSSNEEIRGGEGNALYGKYYHTSTFDITLTDIMFRLEWMALQTGSVINNGGNIYSNEQVTLAAGGTGTLEGTPVAFENYGLIGWASKAGEDVWQQVSFSGQNFTIPGGNAGDIYCIKYLTSSSSARQIVVSSAFIPDTVRLVMTGKLFAGDENTAIASASDNRTVAGTFQIEIPRFQFSGSQEISMTAAGVANTPLSGSALANASADCSTGGYYAIITENISGANWYDNVVDIAVAGGEIELAVDGTSTLVVKAIPTSGAAFTVPNSDLTFTSKADGTATVSPEGVVEGVAAGSTAISVTVTNKPSLEGIAYVTVTG